MPASPDEVKRFEEISQLLLLPGKIFRTTYRGRFAQVDPVLDQVLGRLFAPSTPLLVYDWGASNCLTSAEWARTLFARFSNAQLVASDICLDLVEATRGKPGESWIYESGSGVLLQYLRGPFVVPYLWQDSPVFLVNRFWRWYGRRAGFSWNNIPPAFLSGSVENTAVNGWNLTRIPLAHPEARELALADTRFRMERHSIFDPAARPGHAVRTMNILNRQYFDAAQLEQSIAAVWRSLIPGGLWIVGRTTGTTDQGEQKVNQVSFLRKAAETFELVERIGPGSEIEDLGLSFRAPKE